MKSQRKPPKRKCRWCGAEFEKLRPLQIVCSSACAISLNKRKREAANKKAQADAKRRERAVIKARKHALETKPQLTKRAQAAFNAFIRLRDKHQSCISCGNPLPDTPNGYDAGHYRSVGSAPNLRFNENNCHGQCKRCNNYLSGNHVNYRLRLAERIGLEAVEKLESDNKPLHYTKDDLRQIERLYKEKRRALL
ncbi:MULTISPECIES: recombination protein NinG [Snodgrassella]|uniref:recombination protein NinG n=1 Tax=Snodgrassella TaxID=1193515 RepID=UPI0008157784|nr:MULTISPECIES: recombination protein NinG [Snodgrassella]SCC08978.1 Bacteriophage Lambda NinG protein [Snodgrassella sp. R-53583]